MILIEHEQVSGFDTAIRGMRNPLNSWAKSDSELEYDNDDGMKFEVGMNDLTLMFDLVRAGSDHSKFMRMINVTMDVTAPLYWWKEYDTYKVGTVANSCSTMHTIHKKEFELADFSHEHLVGSAEGALMIVIDTLNMYRNLFLTTSNSEEKKEYWWQLIQLLPTSFNQKRTIQLNYQVLRNIYHARKNHKLDEWRYFCTMIEKLPYSDLITWKGYNK